MPDPLLRRVARDELPESIKDAHQKSMQLRGDATFFEVFANHPELYRWYTEGFSGRVFHGGLVDRRIKELVRLRLSNTHGCRFCNQGNRADAIEAGFATEEIDALVDFESGPFSDREKAALRLADQLVLTNPGGALTEPLYRELREHFSDAEILELGLLLGILSGVAKFLFAFDLVEKEPDCPIATSTG